MMISRTGLHAVRALALLARQPAGVYLRTPAIASEVRAPKNYLGKLLQVLVHAGLVLSQRGHGGGFCLARPADKITLHDILDPFDHFGREPPCLLRLQPCAHETPCAMHDQWSAVRNSFHELLHTTTLEAVLHGEMIESLEVGD